MSKTGSQDSNEGFNGIKWGQELEDDSLAELQRKLEIEFEADFEEADYEQKGFSRENSLPFYTEGHNTVYFKDQEVELEIERNGGLNSLEFWVDDGETMELFDQFIEEYAASNNGEPMIEPYRYRAITGVDVRDLLASFSSHFEIEGPERRPGNGQPRIYPIRHENLGDTEYLFEANEERQIQDSGAIYTGNEMYIPGDAQFQVKGLQQTYDDQEITGQLRIKPKSKRDDGLYNIELDSEDQTSLMYLVNHASESLE